MSENEAFRGKIRRDEENCSFVKKTSCDSPGLTVKAPSPAALRRGWGAERTGADVLGGEAEE
ncbi:hypothetical protein ACSSV4_000639, partial [Roseovarius sp. MBR-154]